MQAYANWIHDTKSPSSAEVYQHFHIDPMSLHLRLQNLSLKARTASSSVVFPFLLLQRPSHLYRKILSISWKIKKHSDGKLITLTIYKLQQLPHLANTETADRTTCKVMLNCSTNPKIKKTNIKNRAKSVCKLKYEKHSQVSTSFTMRKLIWKQMPQKDKTYNVIAMFRTLLYCCA